MKLQNTLSVYARYGKRLFDFFLATAALLVLWPVLVGVAFALALANRGTPFFFQLRPGWHERPFYVVKFKTMTDRRGKDGALLPDKFRLTRIGKWVRQTSLDELPQLVNILVGQMSWVGPRPLLMEYLSLYTPAQHRRHNVRPGITGWAQVNGRNAISWQNKFERDLWYVDNMSFLLDCKILVMSIFKVLKSEGINEPGQATITPFNGRN
ncbi:MAG: sugar transferase [Cyclobacteriaceae bacterium]|jgi:undecaprenyl phosphate N,N'-diacetylbacillosamine 1-phosphate transferase